MNIFVYIYVVRKFVDFIISSIIYIYVCITVINILCLCNRNIYNNILMLNDKRDGKL